MNTENLAILGAITGVIGTISGIINLIFRYKQYKKDSRQIKCKFESKPYFNGTDIADEYTLTISSIGKRDVPLDKYKVFYSPVKLSDKLFKNKLWKNGLHCYEVNIPQCTLKDGDSKVFGVRMKREYYSKVEKISVFDKTGFEWKVKLVAKKEHEKQSKNKVIELKEESTEKRKVMIRIYFLNGIYCFQIDLYANNHSNRTQNFVRKKFTNYKEYIKYKSSIKEVIKKYLNEEITSKEVEQFSVK